jgi:hypothetical protein
MDLPFRLIYGPIRAESKELFASKPDKCGPNYQRVVLKQRHYLFRLVE